MAPIAKSADRDQVRLACGAMTRPCYKSTRGGSKKGSTVTEKDARSDTEEQGSSRAISGTSKPRPSADQARPISEELGVASFIKELLVSDQLILDYLERGETG